MRVLSGVVYCRKRQKDQGGKDKTTSVIQWNWWDDHGYTVGLFQLSDACSRQTGEDWEDHWRQGDQVSRDFTRSIILDMRERLEIGRYLDSWSLSRVGFLRRGEITDSLRIWWNWPEERETLTMLVIVGVKTEAHTFRSHVVIGQSQTSC